MSEVTISKFRFVHLPGERSDAVASFDARVGGFCIRSAKVRRAHADGALWLSVPGSARVGIGISLSPGPVRDELEAVAIARYREETSR